MKMKKWKNVLLGTMLVSSAFLAACSGADNEGKSGEGNTGEKLQVFTTIFPLEDFAKKIGGDEVEVESIYPPNIDAHSYEPDIKTMTNIADADLFIYTGAGVEGFAEKAEKTLQGEKVKIIKAAEGIELLKTADEHSHYEEEHSHDEEDHKHSEEGHSYEEEEHGHSEMGHSYEGEGHEHSEESHSHEEEDHGHSQDDGHHHGDHDPHVWLDPSKAITLAKNIKNSMTELKPEAKEQFEDNFKVLKEQLTSLDAEFKQTIAESNTKYILVSHAAYGYWQERYGLEQIAIAGLSPTQEPSQQQLAKIIEESRKHELNYILFEQNVESRVAKVIQDEIGAESMTLHNLEAVTEEDIKNKEDYFSIMEQNLETLKTVLN
ncbi:MULTISPECIES: metal ABC transporter solute-binding protein, Zn/Mn family [Bacillus]|uniref:metal ABC transporter solute-binding protein, Zn/Mn family n=1 Tax=Bacillus TaxID=1386 RepID=UPI00288159D2|nr:zinc ABC transporter substrate-binding protein [Bacillus sp. AG4(2022)]MDT0163394.1 zinc ABC transporter substrate-binding protein [Bacillus sp. AG4(2022)]